MLKNAQSQYIKCIEKQLEILNYRSGMGLNINFEKHLDLNITVEVRNLVELDEVLQVGGITRIMLDNFELPLMKAAVEIVNKIINWIFCLISLFQTKIF